MSRSSLNILVDILLVGVFFLICLGLGYAVLNRFDPGLLSALSDVKMYGEMIKNDVSIWNQEIDSPVIRNRFLVPYMAKIIYFNMPSIGSFNMINASLLIVNSFFTALSAMVILKMSYRITKNYEYSIVASIFFLLNFNIINFYLVGSVDSAYGLLCLLLIYCLQFNKWGFLPLIAFVGCLIKEVFLPVGSALILGWLIHEYYKKKEIFPMNLVFFVLFMITGIISLIAMDAYINKNYLLWDTTQSIGNSFSPELNTSSILWELIKFILTLGWVILLAMPSLKKLPQNIVFATLLACLVTIFLGWVVGVGGADYARFMFVPGAFLFSVCSAITLTTLVKKYSLIVRNL